MVVHGTVLPVVGEARNKKVVHPLVTCHLVRIWRMVSRESEVTGSRTMRLGTLRT